MDARDPQDAFLFGIATGLIAGQEKQMPTLCAEHLVDLDAIGGFNKDVKLRAATLDAPNVADSKTVASAVYSYVPRQSWPACVERGALYRKSDGHPHGYEFVLSHFVVANGAEFAVCFGIDLNGQQAEWHFAPWQFDGPMAQIERLGFIVGEASRKGHF